MQLPEGQEYQRGYAPGDPMMGALRDLGWNPQPIRAKQVPADWLDPMANLRQADTALTSQGYGRPQIDKVPMPESLNAPVPGMEEAGISGPPGRFNLSALPQNPADQNNYQRTIENFAAGVLPPWLNQGQANAPSQGTAQATGQNIGASAGAFSSPFGKPVPKIATPTYKVNDVTGSATGGGAPTLGYQVDPDTGDIIMNTPQGPKRYPGRRVA